MMIIKPLLGNLSFITWFRSTLLL